MASKQAKRPVYGTIMVMISGLFWSSITILSKIGINAGLDTYTINAARFFIGLAFLFVLFFFTRRHALKLNPKKAAVVIVLGIFDYAVGGILFIGALEYIDAALAFLVLYIYPALVAAGSAILGREKLTWVIAASVTLTIVGVGFLLEAGLAVSGDQWIGVAMVFGAASIFTAYLLIVENLMAEIRSSTATFYSLVGGAVGMLLIIPFVGLELEAAMETGNALILIYMAVFGTAMAVLTFLAGLKHIGSTKAAIITTLEPIFVVLVASIFLNEHLSGWQLFGAGLQIFGFLLMQYEDKLLGQNNSQG